MNQTILLLQMNKSFKKNQNINFKNKPINKQNKRINRKINRKIYRHFNRSRLINISINRLINRSINRLINRLISRSVNKIINKSVNKIINKPVDKIINNTDDKIINKPVNRIINKPGNRIINKPISRLINKSDYKLINFYSNIEFTNLNIKIYILCHSQIILEQSKIIYSKYSWAHPILMKYQDFSFENAFWAHLLEIESEWINCDMVGILSSKAHIKLNLEYVNKIVLSMNTNCNFYHFKPSPDPRLISYKCIPHPNFNIIWSNILQELKLKDCKEYYCNYWICKPTLMVNFINWYLNIALPVVKNHPLIMSNAEYRQGSLSVNKLIELCGVPYYPILPFIIERLNPCYFINL